MFTTDTAYQVSPTFCVIERFWLNHMHESFKGYTACMSLILICENIANTTKHGELAARAHSMIGCREQLHTELCRENKNMGIYSCYETTCSRLVPYHFKKNSPT